MDQPVTEDEHTEKVQDKDRKEKREREGGVKEETRQSKDRMTEYMSACMYMCGSLYDICLCVKKYIKGA